MLLDCPACARSYHVDRANLDGGRLVVCPRCHAEWFVDGPDVLPATPAHAMPLPEEGGRGHLRVVAGLGAIVATLMLLIGARTAVVRAIPRAEALFAAAGMPVNVRGLAFDTVAVVPGTAESHDVAIAGQVRNIAARRLGMPRLAFEVRDAAGAELLAWTETAPARALAAGGVVAFRSAPHVLPEQARSVTVHFETDSRDERVASNLI